MKKVKNTMRVIHAVRQQPKKTQLMIASQAMQMLKQTAKHKVKQGLKTARRVTRVDRLLSRGNHFSKQEEQDAREVASMLQPGDIILVSS